MADEVIIAEAVGVAAGRGEYTQDGFVKSDLAQALEVAMSRAILQAHADGLANDPDAIKARIQEAREATKKQYGFS